MDSLEKPSAYLRARTRPNPTPTNTSVGTPGIRSGWYDANSQVTISTPEVQGTQFAGWVGSGVGSYTGDQNSQQITIAAPVNETAMYNLALTITTTSGGSVSYVYPGGGGVVPAGNTTTVYVPAGTVVSLLAQPASSAYAFRSWMGAGGGQGTKVTVKLPTEVTANFSANPFASTSSLQLTALLVFLVGTLSTVMLISRRRSRRMALA